MKERKSNIELLRIVAILGVIILHINNSSIGAAISSVRSNSSNFYLLYLLESTFIIAVDVFMIISGFFLINSNKRNMWKPIELLFQVIIFSVGKYLIGSMIHNDFQIKGIIRSLIPSNYFVILYISVFIISPYINIMFNNLSDKSKKKFMITIIALFSIYPTMVDLLSEILGHQFVGLSSIGMYGTQYGYSIINFLLCYCIGAYIYTYRVWIFKISKKDLILLFIVNITIITVWSIINDYTGFYTEKSALEYCNPIIVLNSIIIFILFNKIIFTSKVINELSKATFTCFLLHNVLIRKEIVKKIVSYNPIIMVASIIIYSLIIYIITYFISKIYLIFKRIAFKRIENKLDLTVNIKEVVNDEKI